MLKIKEISKQGIDLLKILEGCKLKPYLCAAGIPTIGIGCTFYQDGRKVTLQDREITMQEAIDLLHYHLKGVYRWLNDNLKWEPHQTQYDALCCFLFNTGTGTKFNSYVKTKKAIIEGDIEGIISGMKSIRNDGLLDKRREQEVELFNSKRGVL
jgi:lysozyme